MELFRCRRLEAKLQVSICVARYRRSKRNSRAGNQAVSDIPYKACLGCEIGKLHAARKPTPAQLVVDHIEHTPTEGSMATRRTYPKRPCPCGNSFKPTGPSQRYCGPECPKRPRTPRPKVRANPPTPLEATGPPHMRPSPKQLLELAGYTVSEVQAPVGTLLLVEGS